MYQHSTLLQISAIEASGLCPKLKFINTTDRPGGPYHLKPDISIYSVTPSGDTSDKPSGGPSDKPSGDPSDKPSGDPSDDPTSRRFLDWKMVNLWVENKNNKDDIFRALAEMETDEEKGEDLESHVKWTNSAYKVCGQLLAYASELHRSQFRIFSFAVALFGD